VVTRGALRIHAQLFYHLETDESACPKQNELRRISLRADYWSKGATQAVLKFVDVMAADFVLFLRSAILDANDYRAWYPETCSTINEQGDRSKYLHAQNRAPIRTHGPVVAFKNKNVS